MKFDLYLRGVDSTLLERADFALHRQVMERGGTYPRTRGLRRITTIPIANTRRCVRDELVRRGRR